MRENRKMLDNPSVCKDADYFAVWTYLLLNATHTEYCTIFKGEKRLLSPGQLITGRKVISTKLKIHESKVQRILKWFENDHQIEQQTSNRNRLITILNWDKYQNIEQRSEHLMTDKETTNAHQMTTNNNVKKVKNERNNIYSSNFESLWSVYPRKLGNMKRGPEKTSFCELQYNKG